MRRNLEPAGGWPWAQPGHTFSIDWPPGFVASKPGPNFLRCSEAATATREKFAASGKEIGLRGLSKRTTIKADLSKAAVKRRG